MMGQSYVLVAYLMFVVGLMGAAVGVLAGSLTRGLLRQRIVEPGRLIVDATVGALAVVAIFTFTIITPAHWKVGTVVSSDDPLPWGLCAAGLAAAVLEIRRHTARHVSNRDG